ncbi:TPA: HNH endonuclease [Escherichia coli]|nr:HNH endonuclease [Escherichia coli]HAJ4256174.1 HNH endonuclease [Escherichia coli]HAJ4382475.1 HNH endonuclease [Escherichia coli]
MANLRKEARGRECQVLDIDGYVGRYKITSDGYVISVLKNKVLSHGTKPGGYAFVGLYPGMRGKPSYRMVHRLVAEAFIPNPQNKPEVNHKDGNKQNNAVANLEWVTRNENASHGFDNGLLVHGFSHHSSKLTPEQVMGIYAAEGKYRDIAKNYGVCAQTVCNIKRKSAYRRFLEAENV